MPPHSLRYCCNAVLAGFAVNPADVGRYHIHMTSLNVSAILSLVSAVRIALDPIPKPSPTTSVAPPETASPIQPTTTAKNTIK